MSRHKKYEKKGTKAVIESYKESLEEAEKRKLISEKAGKEFLEADRRSFVKNIIKLNDIFEYRRKAKFKDAEIITRAKNILQSVTYLVLNDIFYAEIQKVREQISIPIAGFSSERRYKDWALQYGKQYHPYRDSLLLNKEENIYFESFGYKKVYEKAETLIKKHKLCFAKDIMHLAPIISRFISRKLGFEKFISVALPSVYENALHCRMDGEMCDKFMRGFEINIIEIEDSESSFFSNHWDFNLFPFTKLTGLGEMFRYFYEREFYCEKNIKDFDPGYLEVKMKRLDVNKNKIRIKQSEKLEVVDNGDYLTLIFTTNFFTKPSDVIKLYKDKKKQIKKLLESEENKFRKIQKRNIAEKFSRNFELWELHKKGLSYDKISGIMYDKGNDLGDSYINSLKGELGEFKDNIQKALKRKIVF
jgi:hypothetical protein